jgi:uncharacterized membrane protein YqaE (UPF0057 family)
MRKLIIVLTAIVLSISSTQAGIIYVPANATDNAKTGVNATEQFKNLDNKTLLSLTPAKMEQLTGKKMTIAQKLALKMAQKRAKKAGDISKGLYIVLAIFGLAWIAMGVMDDWSGSTWIVNLLLTFLFWLPGLIHALVVMKKYYP